MACALVPSIKARLMLPLVILPPKHKDVLFPYQALAHLPSSVHAGPAEIVPVGIRMPDIKCRSRFHGLPGSSERFQQKRTEIRIAHTVVIYFQRVLGFADIIHVVRRVCQKKVCLCAAHQPRHVIHVPGIAAEQPVSAHYPQIAAFRDRFFTFLHGFIYIEVLVFHRFAHAQLQLKPVQLRPREACQREVVPAQIQILKQVAQLFIVPFARYFVQGNVQRLFRVFIQVNDDHVRRIVPQVQQHVIPLVAADNRAVRIDYDRVHVAIRFNAPFNPFVFLIFRGQGNPRIVLCRMQIRQGPLFHIQLCFHAAPPI